MNCRKFHQDITAYLDGELRNAKASLLEAHLEECPACMKLYEKGLKLSRLLGEWREVEPSPDFVEKFWQRAAQMPPAPRWWQRAVDYLRPEGLVAPAVAFVASFFLCVWIYTHDLPMSQHSRKAIPSVSPEAIKAVISPVDRQVVRHLAFLENVDLLTHMDVISNLEVLAVMGSSITEDSLSHRVVR